MFCRLTGGSVGLSLLLLWRLSLWNNPSASECSLDSRGGKGRMDRRTDGRTGWSGGGERARPLLSPRQSYWESFITWLGSGGGGCGSMAMVLAGVGTRWADSAEIHQCHFWKTFGKLQLWLIFIKSKTHSKIQSNHVCDPFNTSMTLTVHPRGCRRYWRIVRPTELLD